MIGVSGVIFCSLLNPGSTEILPRSLDCGPQTARPFARDDRKVAGRAL